MKKLSIFFAFLLFVGFQAAAQMQISGTVTGADDGLSIPGVSIVVKDNPTIGTTTDMDGKYSITVPSNAEALVFSFVGMETHEELINGRSVIDIVMESGLLEMDEVIVVAYGTSKKSSFTGSAIQVKSEQIEKMSTTSFEMALQGSIPGLQVKTNSGQPGSESSLTIRGVGSLNASSQPLYVIDGVPVSSENYSYIANNDPDKSNYGTSSTILSTLNPNDIASITVLKDASAASLYGSRAANGVIVITTKQGKSGEAKIDFSASYGISNLAVQRQEVLGGEEYWKLYWDYFHNQPGADEVTAFDNTMLYLGANPWSVDYPYDNAGNLVSGAELLYDSDWRDAIYKTGKSQEYNLSASGGNEKTNYFISGGYFNQEGIVLSSNFERYSAKLNVTSDINDWLKVGSSTTLGFTDMDSPPGSGGAANPIRYADIVANIYPIYVLDADGNRTYDAAGNPIYDYVNPIVLDFNPLGIAEQDIYNSQQGRALTSLFAEAVFLKDFKFKSLGSVDYVDVNETRYYNPDHGNGASVSGRSYKYAQRDIRVNWTNTLNWNKTIADVHNINILLGQEVAQYRWDYVLAHGTGFAFSGNDNLIAASTPVDASSYYTEEAMESYFSRINYNFSDKYYLSASLRRDGSSKFGSDNKWGTFWSVGATWRATQEEFLKSFDWLTDLKFRVSYGTSGNNDIGRYKHLALYELGYDYGGEPGIQYSQVANPALHWEANKNFDFGVEFRLFNRLSGEFDYYVRTSEDLLYEQPLSFTTGFDVVMTNLAKMENKGVELRLLSNNIIKGDFRWDTDFNIAFNKNEILEMTQEELIVGSKRWKPGVDRYQFYIREYAGVNSATGAAMWYMDIEDAEGNVIGRELTDSYNDATRYDQGSALPDYFGGLTNTLSYKGIDFSFLFFYSMGGYLLDYTQQELMHDGATPGQQLSIEVRDAWQNSGDITDVPVFEPGNASNSDGRSTRYLHDASYIRLRNVALSYNLPQKWIDPVKLRNVKLYIKADNIWTWSAYKGIDPELNVAGTTNNNFPPVKTFTFGINLGL